MGGPSPKEKWSYSLRWRGNNDYHIAAKKNSLRAKKQLIRRKKRRQFSLIGGGRRVSTNAKKKGPATLLPRGAGGRDYLSSKKGKICMDVVWLSVKRILFIYGGERKKKTSPASRDRNFGF